MCPYEKSLENFFNDTRINEPIVKKSGNLFDYPRINVPYKKVWKLI